MQPEDFCRRHKKPTRISPFWLSLGTPTESWLYGVPGALGFCTHTVIIFGEIAPSRQVCEHCRIWDRLTGQLLASSPLPLANSRQTGLARCPVRLLDGRMAHIDVSSMAAQRLDIQL